MVGAARLLGETAEALVAASEVDFLNEDGEPINVWTISCEKAFVRASAPRLAVRAGMRLACRLLIDGVPYQTVVVVTEATGRSDTRAATRLEVVSSQIDPLHRATPRTVLETAATLTAQICDRIVPGETILGTVHDVSEGGIALVVADTRPRIKDLFQLDLRFFEGAIHQEVRVQSSRPGPRSGTTILGCGFISRSANTLKVVERLLSRLDERAAEQNHDVPLARAHAAG
jgi:hypothetical protein